MTDKERAQVIREEVERAMSDMPNGWFSDVANRLREQADLLDQSTPEIPDGTIVEVSLDDGTKMIGYKYGTSLKRCSDGTGAITKVNGKCIRPVRTVEPGSVVLSLAEAEQILPALPLTSPISRIVCGAITKAEQELKND